ncbi:MAG: ester cyclase [Pseudomonadota bacterium]
MTSPNRQIAEAWFRRVWAERDQSAVDELFIQDGEARGLGTEAPLGPEEFKGFHQTMLALMEDISIHIERCMEEGDWIHLLCTFRATARDGGQPVSMTGQILARIGDGVIVEAYNHFDFIRLYEDLGLMPPETFAKALGGQKAF